MRTFICTLVAIATLVGVPVGAADKSESIHQAEIDSAYLLIFQTQLGRAICRQILGADVEAIKFHLGVSSFAARNIARMCPRGSRDKLIFPTDPSDIRKLTLKNQKPRKHKILVTDISFPIESWTEPFTNTTVLVTQTLPLTQERWVQLLAHELAVYFDSKANPAHPDAEQIPELKNLRFANTTTLNPLLAATNPLQGHALTFVRALAVEKQIVSELVRTQKIKGPALLDATQERILSETCAHECLKNLVLHVRKMMLPISLPLLAFTPHYRSAIVNEIPSLYLDWNEAEVARARLFLNRMPMEYLRTEYTGDPVNDMKKVFYGNIERYRNAAEVADFMDSILWPLEERALFDSRLAERNETVLEYMRRPLLSGYNVGLSSGPRVRVRPGEF